MNQAILSYTILWNESPLCNYNYYCSKSDTFSNGFWLKRYDFDILAKISRAIFIYFKFWKTSRRRMSKWKSFTSRVMKVSFYMTLIKIYLDWKPYVDIYLSWMFVRAISHLFCQLCHTLKSNTQKMFSTQKKKFHDVMENRNNSTRNNLFISISIFEQMEEKRTAIS